MMYVALALLFPKCSPFPQTASLRADDHATIGALLFAVLTPALLWKRASIQNCEHLKSSGLPGSLIPPIVILGGAGIGTAVGLLTHYGRTVTGDPAPKIQITEISVSP